MNRAFARYDARMRDISNRCLYWSWSPSLACKFCTTGKNVGAAQSCRRAGLPVGILPIEVSLVVQPEETAGLISPNIASDFYALKNSALRQLARPYVAWKRRPRGSRAAAMA